MGANSVLMRKQNMLITIYCAFFLAFFIAGAICGYDLANMCDVQTLRSHCVSVFLNRPGRLWMIFPLVRFASLLALCGRFRIGICFLPPLFFLRGASAVFYLSAFRISLPESLTVGRELAYFVHMVLSLTVLIGFGWLALHRLYGRNFGRTSYGKHRDEI